MPQEITLDQSALVARRCERDGLLLVREYDEDMECYIWKCPDPDCPYFEIEE